MKSLLLFGFLLFISHSQETEIRRICAWKFSNEAHISADEDDTDFPLTDTLGPGTEECKLGTYSCYTLWKEVKDSNNATIVAIVAQGCWVPSRRQDCPGDKCEGRAGGGLRIFCCCSSDLCNFNVTSQEEDQSNTPLKGTHLRGFVGSSSGRLRLVALAVFGIVLFTLLVLFLAILRKWGPPSKAPLPLSPECSLPPPLTFPVACLKLSRIIGQGRYGTVWLGTMKDEEVAVKVFPAHYCQYFFNERDLYSLPFMDHPSLLKYFGCDENGPKEGGGGLSLVLSYCSLGTLQEYLKANSLDLPIFVRMTLSVAAGLAHLHAEIKNGDNWKPCITHRDVNTRNVLVKPDLSCCLCDLGLAVKITGTHYYTMGGEQHAETKSINDVGTLRYMAPEVLEGAVNLRDCESSLKQIDVYALGLVIWEAASRTKDFYSDPSHLPQYSLPFEKEVGSHPSLESMQTAVCRNKARPLCDWGGGGAAGRLIKETVEDCTDQDGEARLTALCVQERLSQLAKGSVCSNGVSPTVNQTGGSVSALSQFPSLYNNNNNSNCTNNNTENSEQTGEKELTDGGVSEGTVETLVTMSPSEPYSQPISQNSGGLEPSYHGTNPCLERNLLWWEEPSVVHTSTKHQHQFSNGGGQQPVETSALLPTSCHPHPIPYLQNRPFYQGNNGNMSYGARKEGKSGGGVKPIGILLSRPLRRLLGGSGKKVSSSKNCEEGRVIVSPFEEEEKGEEEEMSAIENAEIDERRKDLIMKGTSLFLVKGKKSIGGGRGEKKRGKEEEVVVGGRVMNGGGRRPASLELVVGSDDDFPPPRMKEVSARVKTPGDLPPSVRRKARARLSLYDDRMMGGPLDSTF